VKGETSVISLDSILTDTLRHGTQPGLPKYFEKTKLLRDIGDLKQF